MNKLISKKLLLSGGLLLLVNTVSAQLVANEESVSANEVALLVAIAAIVLALACLSMTFLILVLIRERYGKKVEEGITEESAETTSSWSWLRIRERLTDAVPVTEEASIDMGHNYDGIRELDNNLPPWWKWGFYISIVAAFVYMGVYHMGSGWSSEGEYKEEMAEAAVIKAKYLEKVANQVNETNVQVMADASNLAAGKKTYVSLCVACHGTAGEGGIGPNLTDPYWLHGGSIQDIFKTVKYGVPEKGMIAWQQQLKPKEMQQVSSFIYSLGGTNPPNPKAPQGEIYQPAEENTAIDSTTISMAQ